MGTDSFNYDRQKVWVLAGESSGDLYGARLATEMRGVMPGVSIQGMGGNEMRTAGVDILVDSTELGVVGLFEVFRQLPTFYRIFHGLVARAQAERPDVVILIDYPGFNRRFARKMCRLGIKVIYYVSPQVWAWGRRRIPELATLVTRMLVIFPFETEVYATAGLPTTFVGHPLIRILRQRSTNEVKRDDSLVLLLPGSRFSEVDRLVAPLFETACGLYKKAGDYRFTFAAPRPAIADRVQAILEHLRTPQNRDVPVSVECGDTEILMRQACAGVAASGTVTVQAAILGLPLVVVYKVNPLTYLLGRMLVKVRYITMVNLVLGEEVFEEFLQHEARPVNILPALDRILPGDARRDYVLSRMSNVVDMLGGDINASERAALEVKAELAARGST